ncbi:MAG: hypothetical protein H0X50_06025 [Nitrosopumilus sp.]|nr:hypothetical protein [Nitrosopumilus sp.]
MDNSTTAKAFEKRLDNIWSIIPVSDRGTDPYHHQNLCKPAVVDNGYMNRG